MSKNENSIKKNMKRAEKKKVEMIRTSLKVRLTVKCINKN
jgi:hypothetical protein